MKAVTMLAQGAWGTAVATVLAHNGHQVKLWCHDADVVDMINNDHVNHRYLPDVMVDERIWATADIQQALQESEVIFVAIPVKFFRSVLQTMECNADAYTWVLLNKGIEVTTGYLPSQILESVFKTKNIAVASGPSFAHDIVRKELTGLVVASDNALVVERVSRLLANDYICIEQSSDFKGVQAGGALKNVLALFFGIIEGAGCGENTKALAFVRCFQEIVRLGIALGAQAETFVRLSGLGDCILTSMSDLSRNRLLGKALGQGRKIESAVGAVAPESVNTLEAISGLMSAHMLALPLMQALHDFVHGRTTISALLSKLGS